MAKKKGAGDKPQTFDESNGRYTKESKRAEAERIYDTTISTQKAKNTLTKQEFAIWYQKIGEIKRGFNVARNKNGEMLIPIGNKIVITSGTYENPIARRVFLFASDEDVQNGLKELQEE